MSSQPPPQNPALHDAWKRFADYDYNAIKMQGGFNRLRKWILTLGVAAPAYAIAYAEDYIPKTSFSLLSITVEYRQLIAIALPLVISILVAGASQFERGLTWVVLRGSAETIKSEIYRYRTRVGTYSEEHTQRETREIKLARKLKAIGERLMKTEVNQAGIQPYKGEIPSPYASAPQDDGFSDLSTEQYVEFRLQDQLKFYHPRVERFSRQIRRLNWLIIIMGGVGALIAAIGFAPWIAVTTALAGALTSFMEIKNAQKTLSGYNQVVNDLESIRMWWHALTPAQQSKPSNFEKLVNNTEGVMQSERDSWIQEMRDALAELYEEKPEQKEGPDGQGEDDQQE